MRYVPVLLALALLPIGTASAEEIVKQVDWSVNAMPGAHATVLPPDEQHPEARLLVENITDLPLRVTVWSATDLPPLGQRYALRGEVSHTGVVAPGYLELLNHFGDEAYFTRTLAEDGPLQALHGTSDWRTLFMPFDILRADRQPDRLELNVYLPAQGVVELGPLELIGHLPRLDIPATTGAWWSNRFGTYAGAIGGSLFGILGGGIGLLVWLGAPRRVVFACVYGELALGVTLLVAGMVALLTAQPYAVYYPLLLLGVISTFVLGFMLPGLRQRYLAIEQQRMRAQEIR
jgi:hypothetical protein